MNYRKQRGFTLLEMMVALVIFSILSLMGHQILQAVMRNSDITRQHADRLGETARLFSLLEQDLSQALIPKDLTLSDDSRGAFIASAGSKEILRLIRRNWLNPGQAARSSLQTVSWQLSGTTLTRTSLNEQRITARFSGIQAVRLRFFADNRWYQQWDEGYSLPRAIEITLEIASLGTIQKLIPLSGSEQ